MSKNVETFDERPSNVTKKVVRGKGATGKVETVRETSGGSVFDRLYATKATSG